MQQSFQTQIIQSTLTDCGPKNSNLSIAGVNPTNNSKLNLISFIILVPPIIMTMILFIWSFLVTTAWIHIILRITPPYTHQYPIYSMNRNAYQISLHTSFDDIRNSGSYGIATLIILFSILFPLIKLFYIFILISINTFSHLWISRLFKPRSSKHGIILNILEIFSKYSLANILILLLTMSCLYINIDDHDTDTTINILSTINIEPDIGIVLFGAAIIISSILTIIIKYRYLKFYTQPLSILHLTAQNDMRFNINETNMPTESETQHETQSPLLFSKNFSFRTFCTKMIAFLFMIFVVIGAISLIVAQTAFIEFKYSGKLSESFVSPSSDRIYSIIGIVSSVDTENNDGNTKFLRIIYELFILVFPLITIALLILLWFTPLPKWIHCKLKGIIWITHCLNAIDVLVISSIIVDKELPILIQYIIQNQYKEYCNQLDMYFSNDICKSINLNIYLHDGVWIAAAFYISLSIVVIYSVYFSEDHYSPKQYRKLKAKLKEIQDFDGSNKPTRIHQTIDENKTL